MLPGYSKKDSAIFCTVILLNINFSTVLLFLPCDKSINISLDIFLFLWYGQMLNGVQLTCISWNCKRTNSLFLLYTIIIPRWIVYVWVCTCIKIVYPYMFIQHICSYVSIFIGFKSALSVRNLQTIHFIVRFLLIFIFTGI